MKIKSNTRKMITDQADIEHARLEAHEEELERENAESRAQRSAIAGDSTERLADVGAGLQKLIEAMRDKGSLSGDAEIDANREEIERVATYLLRGVDAMRALAADARKLAEGYYSDDSDKRHQFIDSNTCLFTLSDKLDEALGPCTKHDIVEGEGKSVEE
ncbi:hypothetical protein B0A48_13178 [Cryoendolithus antarcticus]|uniref:Uncharacterized protein n=1 Tax=Cryoendolithus antarcticus TaxID=1507870 RepID=A0A1V8SNS8_9PEZI|nr:hypothetical protein B0A48_13178 [Cryoendolithus antarcticus]